MRKILLFLCILVSVSTFAQHSKAIVSLEKKIIDFGTVSEWGNPMASFNFKNTGNAPLMFLPIRAPKSTKVTLPAYTIQPGRTGTIKVKFYTDKLGPFIQKVNVYHNGSNRPVILTIKGNIQSFSSGAALACPQVGQNNSDRTNSLFKMMGKVTDKHTSLILPGSSVRYINITGFISDAATNENGIYRTSIQPGLYQIKVQKEGYLPLNKEVYLKRNETTLDFELEKDPNYVPATTTKKLPTKTPANNSKTIEPKPKYSNSLITEDIEEESASDPFKRTKIKPSTKPVTTQPLTNNQDKVLNNQYLSNNIVLLLDVSLSMKTLGKLNILKSAIKELVKNLRPIDKITIISYAYNPQIEIIGTPANNKKKIIAIIDSLKYRSGTRGVVALKKAYEIAKQNYIPNGNNQIIIATDGLFHSRGDNIDALHDLVRKQAIREKIILSPLAFDNRAEVSNMLNEIAKYGKGTYIYVDANNIAQSKQVLLEEIKSKSFISSPR